VNKLTFKDLDIATDILRAIDEMGFSEPTEIQAKGIPLLTNTTKDFVGQAQTGTGKTAAFVIPILEKINEDDGHVQALILTPTRELAFQVETEIKKLGKYRDVGTTCIYGGTSYEKQIRALKKDRPQVVVGTPGRVIDLINKGILKLSEAQYCVLDEADEMLNMGFFEDVQTILDIFQENRQLIMFSATMPRQILNLISKSFHDYEMVKIKNKTLSNENIDQKFFVVREKYFKESLARLIDASPEFYGIVFCRTRLDTKDVGEDLKKRGHSVEILNGDMGQAERDYAMRNFKEKRATIMVCTDVAARGIDVTNLTHVVNYGLPQDNESYVHRIGRTGRAGEKGLAYTLVSPNNTFAIRRIEKHINRNIDRARLPSVKLLKEKMVEKEMEKANGIFEAISAKDGTFEVDSTFEMFQAKFGELSQDQLLKLMFTWKFNQQLRNYNNLADIEMVPSSRNDRSGGNSRGRSQGGARGGRSRRPSGGGPNRNSSSSRSSRSGNRSSQSRSRSFNA
jgi:ATP-dependent RNA helicase DeaD